MDLITQYLKEIRKYPVLSNDEFRELLKKYKGGDLSARQKILTSNLRLVVSIAKRYAKGESEKFLEYIQEGNLGLDDTIDRFELSRECRFSTYATIRIEAHIRRALRKSKRDSKNRVPMPSYDKEENRTVPIEDNSPNPEEETAMLQRIEQINGALSKLPLEERVLLEARYGLSADEHYNGTPLSLGECVPIFKRTIQAISVRERKILEKLRYRISASLL